MSDVPPPSDDVPAPSDDVPPPSDSPADSPSNDASKTSGEPSTSFEENVKRRSTWLRLLFMIIVWLLYQVAEFVAGVVIIIQFLWVLFTGKKNPGLVEFGQSLSTYVYQALRYLTFNTEQRPFPFDLHWPPGPPEP